MKTLKYIHKTQNLNLVLYLTNYVLLGVMLTCIACQSTIIPTVQATPPNETLLTIISPSPTSTSTSTPIPTATTTVSPTPVPTPAIQGQVAVTAGSHLFVMDISGDNIISLVPDIIVSDFAWSPDGEKLAFSGRKPPESRVMYIMDGDGSNITRLNPTLRGGALATNPSWSPNGEKITFQQSGGVQQYIHTMSVDGTDQQLLIEGNVPVWSPDGEDIAFIKRRPHNIFGDLYIIGVDGSNLRQLTEGESFDRPSWSPDGKYLLVYGYDAIWKIKTDGSGERKRLHRLVAPATWSIDGQYIFFADNRNKKVMVMNANGTNPVVLSALPSKRYGYVSQRPIN